MPTSDLTCTSRLLIPLLRLLDADGTQPELRARVSALVEPERRIPLLEMAAALDDAAAALEDPDLGLHTATHVRIGDFSAFEWVVMSASNWREATDTACRYAGILSDGADFRHEIVGDRSHLILGSTFPASRVFSDFAVATYLIAGRLHATREESDREVWFEHERPADIGAYEQVFPGQRLVFGAAFNGTNGPVAMLQVPLQSANLPLHDVLREHADRVREEIAPDGGLVARVCADILTSVREGRAKVALTASRLGMSQRTLTRQLARHGTSYKKLLNRTRYRTAVHYLRYSDETVEDIAFLLGFSECAALTRAFREWSGVPPAQYRREHGTSQKG